MTKRDTPTLRRLFPPQTESNAECYCGKGLEGMDETKAPYEVSLWVRWPEIAGNEQPFTFCSAPCFLKWIKTQLKEFEPHAGRASKH